MVLSTVGCASWAGSRLETFDGKVAAADSRLAELAELAVVQPGPEVQRALEAQEVLVAKLAEDRDGAREDAHRDSESSRAMWMALLVGVTGTIKVVAGIARGAS